VFKIKEIEIALQEALFVYRDKRVLLACSGGIDSVVLAHVLKKYNYDFGIAHMNYGLRGKESQKDEECVADLARDLGVEFHVKHAKLNTSKSIQEEARTVRYDWFFELRRQFKYDLVATAHHADDSLEGMIMSVFSGATLSRLGGITDRENLIRPFQHCTKEQLIHYAKSYNISYREDSSNRNNEYLRNYVRNKVLTDIEAQIPNTKARLLHSLEYFRQLNELTIAYRKHLEKTIVRSRSNCQAYAINGIVELRPLALHLRLLFEPFGFADFSTIEHLLVAENGKEILSATYRLVKFEEELLLGKIQSVTTRFRANFGDVIPRGIAQSQMVFTLEVRDSIAAASALEVRLWNSEDSIKLKGQDGTKKVSKYLRDLKIDPITKSSVQILLCENRLVAILGYAIDADFSPLSTSSSAVIKIWHE
jgi:tRNA(Ile)-lysidine synthase